MPVKGKQKKRTFLGAVCDKDLAEKTLSKS